jgi:FkbM family methyltransferase
MKLKKRIKKLLPDLAWKLGYDLDKSKKQLVIDSHLKHLFAALRVDFIIDAGAHRGEYAHLLRNKLGYKGVIHSFEPLPAAFKDLASAAESDAKWFVHNCALGAENGTATLSISEREVFSSLHATSDYGKENYGGRVDSVENVEVQVRRLEDVIKESIANFDQHRAFLKMDTQGHDKWVFEGAGQYQQQFLGLQSEVSVHSIYADTPDYMDMMSMYRDAGFELTGVYAVSRESDTARLAEVDCVFARENA